MVILPQKIYCNFTGPPDFFDVPIGWEPSAAGAAGAVVCAAGVDAVLVPAASLWQPAHKTAKAANTMNAST